MATVYSSAQSSYAVTTDGTLKRTVNDKIRNLFPGSAVMLALVATGAVKGQMIKTKKGFIGKKKVASKKFESFTYTPLAIEFTVTTWSDPTLTVSSSTGLLVKYTIFNTANNTQGRVSAISTNDLTITDITGATGFSASAGDKILCLATAYEENSSSPGILQKDFDNLWNVTQIMRYSFAVSGTAKNEPHYGMKNYFKRIKENGVLEGNRRIENTLIWSERASTEGGTTDATLSDTFRTTRGLYHWAQGSYDAGYNMTPEMWRRQLVVDGMNDTFNESKEYTCFCSREFYARVMEWQNEKMQINQDKELKKFGIKASRIETSGPCTKLIVHDSFNRGGNVNKAIIFNPEDVFYAYHEGRDLAPKNGIQSNSTDGYQDEMIGEIGLGVLDGGSNITVVSNLFTI